MPGGYTQRSAGLFWPDGQYRLARPGSCGLTLDRGDGTGGGECVCPRHARDQRAEARAETRGIERHRGQGVGLRDSLSESGVARMSAAKSGAVLEWSRMALR